MPEQKLFTDAELAAFVPDAIVEWRIGAHWYPARIAGERGFDQHSNPTYPVRYLGPTTRTNIVGSEVVGYPGHLRLPSSASVLWDGPCMRITLIVGIPFQEWYASRDVPTTAAATEVLTALGYTVGEWVCADGQANPDRPVWNTRVVGKPLRQWSTGRVR